MIDLVTDAKPATETSEQRINSIMATHNGNVVTIETVIAGKAIAWIDFNYEQLDVLIALLENEKDKLEIRKATPPKS